MTRGVIDLSQHKLAGLFRPPAQRTHWYRRRPVKMSGNETYRQIWRLVDGAVRDAFANHPEYLTTPGRRHAQESITKRVTGALYGYAAQAARGRSVAQEGTPVAAAANQSEGANDTPRFWQRLPMIVRQWRSLVLGCAKNSSAVPT